MANLAFSLAVLAPLASASALGSSYSFEPLHHLGGIAPYFESLDPPASPDAPQGCKASRAAYLVRHAAIYANDFDFEEYIEPFIEKLQNKSSIDWSSVPYLNFLAEWEAPVSDAETSLLTRLGRLEATRLGVDLNFRYPNLTVPRHVWTSSAERTVKSAKSFAHGLEGDDNSIDVIEIYESEESGADSLTPYKACPWYSGETGSNESSVYQDIYTKPIIGRLSNLSSEFNFTVKDVFGMQQLCGYETVIRGSSPFCSLELFTPDDWLGWEYTEDVRYHYNVGYGNEASGYVGLPWLNATAALLLSETSEDAEDLYVSFTHRELPPMVLVAMGLFNTSAFASASNVNETLPLGEINYRRAWRSSHVLPFLSNIAVERFDCSGSFGFDDGEYYRILVNSAPQPLPGCHDGPGTSCSRDSFKTYVQQRVDMFTGFSEKCGVKYDNSTDILNIYDAPRRGNSTI